MAHQDRRQIIDLNELLLRDGHKISYIQVLRLLRVLLQSSEHSPVEYERLFDSVRVRPELGLSFPSTDIVSVDKYEHGQKDIYKITAAFMGLYGSSSPLPTFYTEDLIDEQREGGSITREFLDVINGQFYRHFFAIWEKYSVFHQLTENPDNRFHGYLYSLLGLAGHNARQSYEHSNKFLAYIGLVSQSPRSASGLRSILSDSLQIDTVEVEQCVQYMADISEDQHFSLGLTNHCLGENSHLGSQVADMMGKFRIHISSLTGKNLQLILPDSHLYKLLHECVRLYLDQPLTWDVELDVMAEEIETTQLGNESWGKLGWNSWIFSGSEISCPGKVPLLGDIN